MKKGQEKKMVKTAEWKFIEELMREYGSQDLFFNGHMLESENSKYDIDMTNIEEITYSRERDMVLITESSGEMLVVDFKKDTIKLLNASECAGFLKKFSGDEEELQETLDIINTAADRDVEYRIINGGIIETDYKLRCTCLICMVDKIDKIGFDRDDDELTITLKDKKECEVDTIIFTKHGADM